MDWYLEEASAIFYPMSERRQFEQDACELYAWIMTRIRQNNWCAIRKTDIERYGPNRLRRAEKLTPVLNQLIAQNYFCIIKMRSHQALYVSVRNNNGYLLPFGTMSYEPFDVVPSLYSHNAKIYPVNIPPELIQSFALPFSAYNLFWNKPTQMKRKKTTFIRRLVVRSLHILHLCKYSPVMGRERKFLWKNRYGSNSSSTCTMSVIWFCFHNDLLSKLIEYRSVRTGGRVAFVFGYSKENRNIVFNIAEANHITIFFEFLYITLFDSSRNECWRIWRCRSLSE